MDAPNDEPTADFGSLSSNIISDFAPILALFGEQVAKQFLSQSMGWGDHIIFSMAPLGIITAVVSAIRVGGPQWLKAIVGRARENRAAAELELMSSTSHEVCELWNGQNIVRTLGAPDIRQIIYIKSTTLKDTAGAGSAIYELHTLDDEKGKQHFVIQDVRRDRCPVTEKNAAVENNNIQLNAVPGARDLESTSGAVGAKHQTITPSGGRAPGTTTGNDRSGSAPNIALNISSQVPEAEIYSAAVFAVLLQVGVLVYAYFATYNSHLKAFLQATWDSTWAWYCTLIGTILLVTGLLACCLIIEKSTIEKRYRLKSGDGKLLWVQKGQTVSDQVFCSSVIFTRGSTSTILTSRRNEDLNDLFHPTSYATTYGTTTASILSISGFIIQFMGLRGMHWSVSVAQFLSTAIMGVLRAILRRSLSDCPEHHQLPTDHEIDWLSVRFSGPDGALNLWDKYEPTGPGSKPVGREWRSLLRLRPKSHFMGPLGTPGDEHFKWNIVSGALNSGYGPPNSPISSTNSAQIVVNSRERLAYLTRWPGVYSDKATSLAAAIECVMNMPDLYKGTDPFLWWMRATKGGDTSPEVIELQITRVEERWVVNLGQVEAVLSLWMYSAKQNESGTDEEVDAWLRSGKEGRKTCIRLLGRSTPLLRRDLRWWMGVDAQSIMESETNAGTNTAKKKTLIDLKQHGYRVVGSAGKAIENTGHSYVPMSLVDRDGVDNNKRECDRYPGHLISLAQCSLQSLFALDMFTAFMWAFAASPGLNAIGINIESKGQTTLDEYSQTQSEIIFWDTIRLHSPTLSKIASELEETGLGNSHQLFLSIIPPLSVHRKLPDTLAVVENIHQKTKELQRGGQWRQALDMYIWVLECFLDVPNYIPMTTRKGSGWEERSCVMAIAASMEFLWTLREEIQKNKDQKLVLDDELRTGYEKLRRSLIESKFHSSIEDILLGLAHLYELQDRRITWEPLLSIYNSRPQGSTTPPVTKLHKKIIDGSYEGGWEPEVDQKDDLGWTALHYMAKDGREDMITHLVENGQDVREACHADWRAVNLSGWTPLHYAALHNSLKLKWEKMDRRKLDVNIQGRDGVSPLHCAGRSGNVHTASHLITFGANLDACDTSRKTPLHWSAYHCSVDVFKLILASGAQFRSLDAYGRTCLHLAAMSGSMEIVNDLLQVMSKMEINLRDRSSRTALWMACSFGHHSILETLSKHRNDISQDEGSGLLYEASKEGHSDTVRFLLQQPTNASSTQKGYDRSLIVASEKGHVEVVRLLLEDVTSGGSGADRDDALFMAIRNGHLEIIKLLRRGGFRIKGDREDWEAQLLEVSPEVKQELIELLSDEA